MRITPQAVWGHKLSDEELYKAVKLQTNFTHSNQIAVESCYLYCWAIKLLITQDFEKPSQKSIG
jgi:ADP-ribosylglycohydrolase